MNSFFRVEIIPLPQRSLGSPSTQGVVCGPICWTILVQYLTSHFLERWLNGCHVALQRTLDEADYLALSYISFLNITFKTILENKEYFRSQSLPLHHVSFINFE